MVTDRDKEKESELESSMYTNCLLLGLDPAVLGGARSGLFRRSNPKMGEQLLYFLLSSLRGPKDFEKVWPIFDSAQSRDFRKIVQAIITELESQGALPRSNSRVSSLATCCGPRFVELLWQLSVHVLREVHRRSFPSDVAANQLPAPLTDVSYLHAASLLPVSKARIALERKKFLKNANTAVHRQAMQSELAQEMTAQFRVLCAEQAYLQQEMEKLQDLRNKAKLEAEFWDDRVPSSSSQTAHMVSKATRMWESLLACKSQHEVLASGPIEDLVAHREHRYRISGASLLAAMESSSPAPHWDNSSVLPGDMTSRVDGPGQLDLPHSQGSNDSLSRADDRSGRLPQTVDVAEVLRRWTHALQRIHKQSLYMAKANDGEGPELLRVASEAGSGGHAETLTATLAEHRQHLVSIEGLINQLKEAVPAMQKSILDLTDEVNTLTSNTPVNDYDGRLPSSIQGQSSGRAHEHGSDEISEMTSKLSSVQLDKSSSSPAMKLPHLFSLTPNLSGKGATTKKNAISTQTSHVGSFITRNMDDHPLSGDGVRNNEQGDDYHIQNLRRAVRQVALTRPSNNEESSHISRQDNSYDGSQHFFMPLSTVEVSHKDADRTPSRAKQDLDLSHGISLKNTRSDRFVSHFAQMSDEVPNILSDDGVEHGNGVNGHSTPNGLDTSIKRPHLDFNEGLDQVFSPPLLMDSSFFADAYEDLLAPLSETDAALMEQRGSSF